MRARTALALSLSSVVALGALSPAVAAPAKPKPKPVSKSYTATAMTPDPTPVAGEPVSAGVCEPTLPTAKFSEPLKVPFAGTLKITMSGFQGDWDLGLFQGGRKLAESAQDVTEPVDRPETIVLKIRKPGTVLEIRSCNFTGGPTAAMTYVLTPS